MSSAFAPRSAVDAFRGRPKESDNRYLMSAYNGQIYIDDMAALGPDGYERAVRMYPNAYIVDPDGGK